MSLHPDNAYCPNCGGVDLTGMGSFGRKLKSRCKCADEAVPVPYTPFRFDRDPESGNERVAA